MAAIKGGFIATTTVGALANTGTSGATDPSMSAQHRYTMRAWYDGEIPARYAYWQAPNVDLTGAYSGLDSESLHDIICVNETFV
jgi:hypothetical protein